MEYTTQKVHTLVIGSGASGLAAAVQLHIRNITDIAIYTEGLAMGTSVNTGSDKQTYYKLGMYGSEPDSPVFMARDLARGGSMHGDIALIEAAVSAQGFFNLVNLGVPFPHDVTGQHIGYKTDHDPKRRATSCGPYTSKNMVHALIDEVRRRNINVCENRVAVKLLTDPEEKRAVGAIFVNTETGKFEVVQAENTVFAVGGPGGLYEQSVYPKVHTGAIGLALEAGAKAYNLAESQFGLASLKFRWNVSGSYMQVLPRFVSTAEDGSDEREFLREYFDTAEDMYSAIFLKGYQWPFAAGHVPGSSLIDIYTYIETVERNRKVYLDYRSDPEDLDIEKLSGEAAGYLKRSNALASTPIERLKILNSPAIELYKVNDIDLEKEMLEIAVCAQHNNGGLAGNIWWESVNIKHLFPVGEVNGTHGVTRPGGTALNSGQVGAVRAAEFIAGKYSSSTLDPERFKAIAAAQMELFEKSGQVACNCSWQAERKIFQKRMSQAGAFIRSSKNVVAALDEAYKQLAVLQSDGLQELAADDLAETLRNRQLLAAQVYYLEAILMQIDRIGSRGGALVLADDGVLINDKLSDAWRIKPEAVEYRDYVMYSSIGAMGFPEIGFEKCRPVPEEDGWFENIWKDFRTGAIYDQQP
ncbi:MAG: FAD-binding protein [Lentisphaerae bacterium]|nr:FAD-binding protein [Lentisphaerota bacterium]